MAFSRYTFNRSMFPVSLVLILYRRSSSALMVLMSPSSCVSTWAILSALSLISRLISSRWVLMMSGSASGSSAISRIYLYSAVSSKSVMVFPLHCQISCGVSSRSVQSNTRQAVWTLCRASASFP